MELNRRLRLILKAHFNWSKPRLSCLVALMLALLRVQRMNLSRLAVAMGGEAQIESRYRRLQRFFSEVRFDYDALARLIMQLFDFSLGSYYLTLDRTNWRWGERDLNILTLAVVYKGTAIPIYWLVLLKRGNSNQRERIALLSRFIARFGHRQIQGLLGDREFIGQRWWAWLSEHSIPFVMRMKESQHVLGGSASRPVRCLFSGLQPGKTCRLRQPRLVSGQWIYLNALRLDSGELLILASNTKLRRPFEVYALRWEIETLFQCLKGRGFNVEDTRLTRYFRIKKMMAVLTLTFCWAHKTGEWRHTVIKPLKNKAHGRPAKSLFRYGLDYLADQLIGTTPSATQTLRMLLVFLCPPCWMRGNKDFLSIVPLHKTG